MLMQPHKIGLVLDRSFGHKIETLAQAFHIWVIESPENTPYIQSFWKSQRQGLDVNSIATGITSFVAEAKESSKEVCVRVVGDVDEHHGDLTSIAPWSEFEVFGVKLNSKLQQIFKDIGGTVFEPTENGFICRRSQLDKLDA